MSITYTWEIPQLEYTSEELPQVVREVHWSVSGETANGVIDSRYGSTKLNVINVSPNTFVAFEDLTLDIILGWLGDDFVSEQESKIAHTIEAQIASTNRASPPPWSE